MTTIMTTTMTTMSGRPQSSDVEIRRRGRGWRLETEMHLPRAPQEVFPYFAEAGNLQQLTPAFLNLEILTPLPIEMQLGTAIDYRIRLHGLPIHWRTEITEWDPPYKFVDTQVRGPYRWWIHEHQFLIEREGTRAADRVDYGITCGRLAHPLFVKRDLRRIFSYRAARLQGIFVDPSS
jgi:ligand-binding SRPBCC domain-containing protein